MTRIISRVKKAKLFFRSFDPQETPWLSAADAFEQVAQSFGVLVHLLPERIADSPVHNIQTAFLAGLADGFAKVLLILQEGEEPVPLDYRDLVTAFLHPSQIDDAIADFAPKVTEAMQEKIRGIHLEAAESEIIVERLDGSKTFLEVFCVMPSFPLPEDDKFKVYSVKTRTQTEMASIRQKLLRTISKQSQLKKPRENFAVIELNDVSIAGDFAVLSSLSGGYKMNLGVESGKVLSRGYDWDNSVFNDPSTQFLKGIIYFSLGDYESRKFIFNPKFVQSTVFLLNVSPPAPAVYTPRQKPRSARKWQELSTELLPPQGQATGNGIV